MSGSETQLGVIGGAGHDTRRDRMAVGAFVALMSIVAVAATLSTPAFGLGVPFLLALSPAVIGIVLAKLEGADAVTSLLRTVVRRPSRRRWYLVALMPVVEVVLVLAIAIGLGTPTVGLFDRLTPAALILPLVVLIPAFAEELGWRGYGLRLLARTMSPLAATVILGVPWALLHLALFVPGGLNEGRDAVATVITIFAYAVLLGWAFLRSGGSLLIAGLLHASLNAVVPLTWGVDDDLALWLRTILAVTAATIVVLAGGFRMTGQGASRRPVRSETLGLGDRAAG